MSASQSESNPALLASPEPCPEDTLLHELIEGVLAAAEAAQLSAHLERCSDCRRTVSMLVQLDGRDSRETEPASEPAAWTPGLELGRYRLGEPLGRGSMGQVFAAHDRELDREVAIKRLFFEPWAPADARRAAGLAEARALAQLDHPNVVRVYEVATLAGWPCVIMERIAGQSLRRWQLEQRPTRAALLYVYTQAAQGLAAVHARGLVHRDFKPDNVLLTSTGQVKIIDFGLARAVPDGAATVAVGGADPARASSLAGTPGYMAPEQLEGHKARAASDQFAFCVALTEAFTGQRPFAGHDPQTLLAALAAGLPDALAQALPRALRAPLRRGLSRDPAQRLPSMQHWAAILSAMPRRERRLWLALSATGLLAAGGLGAFMGSRSGDPCGPAVGVGAQSLIQEAAALRQRLDPQHRSRLLQALAAGVQRAAEQGVTLCARRPDSASQLACLVQQQRAARILVEELGHLPAAQVLALGELGLDDPARCGGEKEARLPVLEEGQLRQRVRLRIELARLFGLLERGRRATVVSASESLLAAAEAHGDPELLVDVLTVAGIAGSQRGDRLQTAAELAARHGLHRQQRIAAAFYAVELERAHRTAEADAWLRRAQPERGETAAQRDDELAGLAAWADGMLLGLRSRYHEAATRLQRAATLLVAAKGDDAPVLASLILPALAAVLQALNDPTWAVHVERAQRLAATYASTADPVRIALDLIAISAPRGESFALRKPRFVALRERAAATGEKELALTIDDRFAEAAEAAGDLSEAVAARRRAASATDERTRLPALLWRLRQLAEVLLRAELPGEARDVMDRERTLREREGSLAALLSDRQYVSLIAMYHALPKTALAGRVLPTLPVLTGKVLRFIDGTGLQVLDAVRVCFARPPASDLCVASDAWGLLSVPEELRGAVRARIDRAGYHPALFSFDAAGRAGAATLKLFPEAMATATVAALGLSRPSSSGWIHAGAELPSGAGVAGVRLELSPSAGARVFYLSERGVLSGELAATSGSSRDGALFGGVPPGTYQLTARLGAVACQRMELVPGASSGSATVVVESGRVTLVPDFICPRPAGYGR